MTISDGSKFEGFPLASSDFKFVAVGDTFVETIILILLLGQVHTHIGKIFCPRLVFEFGFHNRLRRPNLLLVHSYGEFLYILLSVVFEFVILEFSCFI